jgi:uncharacterized cupredoxin-like copper-binding protein
MEAIKKSIGLLALLAIGAFALAGCGASTSNEPSAAEAAGLNKPAGSTASTSAAKPGHTLDVALAEYSIKTSAPVVAAGKVKVTATNDGQMPHEAVFLKTDTPQGKLKVTNGRVSEKDSVGEVSDVKSGTPKSNTLDLKPGKYVIVCNIAGHYQAGMHAALIVK